MYIQLMGRISALPNGAAATPPLRFVTVSTPAPPSPPTGTTSWPGRKGAKCAATPMVPTPGPPPPCGMQNVLCRLRWQTSAPMNPGEVSPTCAFMFAPSMYTWPPRSCTMDITSLICVSKTPNVEGYVTISAASSSACLSALARRSSMSISPSSVLFTTTTSMPAMAADAGLVPCALTGMRHLLRWPCPVERRYSRMASSPAYSPAAPLLGCVDIAAKPVISRSASCSVPISAP
mmetsp:Transcript_75958/g.183653  ORF Transcript_75958/g.183653 Transcript_75958/m.183653 type:complete len:234 (-) Transcript_75958:1843-2544(-)